MSLPSSTRTRIRDAASLLFPGQTENPDRLLESLSSGRSGQPAVLWCGSHPFHSPFPLVSPPLWAPHFVDCVDGGCKPGASPLHAEGSFYSLDLSSVISASVVLAIPGPVSHVLDLCASPGGKSVFASLALTPTVLVANEVIGKRTGPLISNLKRCSISNARVIRLDPTAIATRYPQAFDLVLVDAPCSGQSLLAKNQEAPGAFNPLVVRMNANRQRRILSAALGAVRPGGYLAYMTCTYAPQENEETVQWILDRFPSLEAVPVPHLDYLASPFAPFPSYRHWPFTGAGVGGFACLLRTAPDMEHVQDDFQDMPVLWQSPVQAA